MRCGLVRRVVIQYLYWSIMIYITFMVKQDGFKKGHALHNWHNILFTSLVHTFKRGERPTMFSSSVSVSPKRASVLKSRLLQCSKAVFFSSNDRTLVVGLRAFSLDSNLSGCGAQCRFTTCSNVSQDKKTTAEGYWWQNNNTPALLAGQKRRKQDFIEI